MLYITSRFFTGLQLGGEAPTKCRFHPYACHDFLDYAYVYVAMHTLLPSSAAFSHSRWNVNPPPRWRKWSIRPDRPECLQEKERGLVEHTEGLSKSATSSIVLLWKHPTLEGKEKKKVSPGLQGI